MMLAAGQRRLLHTVRGSVSRVIFKADGGDFAVLQVRVQEAEHSEGQPTVARGSLLTAAGKGGLGVFGRGVPLTLSGDLVEHPTYGQQLKVQTASHSLDPSRTPEGDPAQPNAEEVASFLSSGLFKGIGPKVAASIVETLGDDTMAVLNNEDGRFMELARVKGVGPTMLRNLAEQWGAQRSSQELITFLQRHGASTGLAHRCIQTFGSASAALAVLRAEPYRLALSVPRVAFPTADALARSIHGPAYAGLSPPRLHAALVHVLQASLAAGHTALPQAQLLEETQELLGRGEAPPAPAQLQPALHRTLQDLVQGGHCVTFRRVEEALHSTEATSGKRLSAEQTAAVMAALQHPVSIISGGPGTGKTHALRTLVQAWRYLGKKVVLACPTARAAHRLNALLGEEAGGEGGAEAGGGRIAPATTLHKLLEYGRGGVTPLLSAAEGGVGDAAAEGTDGATPGLWKFGRHAGRPLDADAILVDEASMLDVELGAGLLDALPPVGPGRVFGDLLASGQVHVSRLTTMFRQAAASAIKRNAAMANAGAVPTHFVRLVPGQDGGVEEEAASPSSWQASGLQPDCFFVPAPEAADVVPGVVQVALRHAMAAGASRHDVQVLAPMRRGPAGTDALNAALQAELNPHAAAMRAGGQEAPTACLPDSVRGWLASTVKLAVGDRVMQQANDYSKGVMNGDTGTVVRITWAGGDLWEEGGSLRAAWRGRRGANPRPSTLSRSARVTVRFLDGGPGSEAEVEYSLGEANARLTLAYAVTVHKAQGQEYPVVITAAHTAHYVMLSRGLLYTALSRATQAAYIVGTKPAMAVAVRNTLPARRDTQLCDILRGAGQ
ncbi:yrrC, partial [Symbiodinium sp. KB8]